MVHAMTILGERSSDFTNLCQIPGLFVVSDVGTCRRGPHNHTATVIVWSVSSEDPVNPHQILRFILAFLKEGLVGFFSGYFFRKIFDR